MSDKKEYCINISMSISKHGEENNPFSQTKQSYHGLSYEEMVMVQKALADSLLGLGEKKAKGGK